MDDEKSLVRLMAIWNVFKHSAPSFVSLRTYDNTFYYLIGDVWVAVDDVTNYVNEANVFARKYFTMTGYEV